MTCAEMKRLLPRIAERDGTPRVAFESAKHLSTCAVCAAELLRLREMNGLLDRLPQPDVPDSFPARVLRSLRSKGGSGLALLALLALGGSSAAVPSGGAAGSILSALASPFEAASNLAGALSRTAMALLAALQQTMGGSWALLPHAEASSQSHFFPLLVLALFGAASFAGSWAAFGLGALRFRRERRTAAPPAA